MISTLFEYGCLTIGIIGAVGLGWGLCALRYGRQAEREMTARAAPSGPPAPDLDGAPPFGSPPGDDDVDDDTAAWLASLHNGFMDAYRADEALVREWIELGCMGPMPEAPSWDEDELVLRGLIMSRAEMLAAEDDESGLFEMAGAR
jgi:hypothetical protein